MRRQVADSFQQFKRSSFDISKLISVTFLAESAVDGDGPSCEIFHLLLAELFSVSGLFTGYLSAVTTSHNMVALQSKDYRVAGKIVSASIVQTGIAPVCFSYVVADFMVYGEVRSRVEIANITDQEIRIKMEKVICLFVKLPLHHFLFTLNM